ncbi:SDR family NAD(P)-dependent oxidoreductase [Chitinophaga agrisoli]|uniref:SDR family NAD(P)-dependent oxidoreductase n=1 Tax=Chitinophaga agrisoli TaxID=2607653 RepID=A0A5B2VJ16_9BACT|nr:oxidoreductase [Chitinophaga agrisoli]KAA2239573.1 SDR family NAD(P)-dependent oxidoreductase [Chitinophaga agrisoli]
MWTKKDIPAQNGKTVIVTGANAGIGYETALALYEAGAHVVLACRSLGNAQLALDKIKAHKGAGTLEIAQLDLASLAAVKRFAQDFLQKHQQLHILINNAGVMIPPASKTEDGFELQFGVNFIGHFALTGHLYPLLKATPGSRVVTVSSMAYVRGVIDFSNLHSEHSYDAMREYCQSKLANILFTLELERRITATGGNIRSIAAQPGANKTELSRHMTQEQYDAAVQRIGELMEAWQGALPSLYAAVMPDAAGADLYSPDQDNGYRGYPAKMELLPHALDEALAKQLWEYAEEVTGVKYPA